MGTPNIQGVDEGLAWSQTQNQKCLTPPVQRQQISKSPERLMNLTVTAIPDGQSPTTSELARGRTDDQLNYVTGGKTSGFFTGPYKWLFRTLEYVDHLVRITRLNSFFLSWWVVYFSFHVRWFARSVGQTASLFLICPHLPERDG